MYCVKCGIELSEGQEICPVCQTKVYHPDFLNTNVTPKYPRKDFQSEAINIKGLLFVITILSALPILLCGLFDIIVNDGIVWSGYVGGGVVLLYVCAILPLWFKHPNPTIFTPCSFLAAAAYLWYINYATQGDWFLSFGMPVVIMIGTIFTAVVTLLRYLKRGRLYIFGGAFILFGVALLFVEFFMDLTFGLSRSFIWGLYPMCVFSLIGIALIVIGIVKPFKESLRKIFYL